MGLRFRFFFLFVPMLGILFACSTLPKGTTPEPLLIRNRVVTDKPVHYESDLQDFIRQKPNRKIFGLFRLYNWVYSFSNQGRSNGLKRWLNNAIAEKPIRLDSGSCLASCMQMKRYLDNLGYYHSIVSYQVRVAGKTARVKYSVIAGNPYRINKIDYVIPDEAIRGAVVTDLQNTLIRKDDIFNAYVLDHERDRISIFLKNRGYYFFSKEYISYLVDTAFNKDSADLELRINDPRNMTINDPDSLVYGKHKPCMIRKVLIFPEYNPLGQDTLPFDTLVCQYREGDDKRAFDHYYFIHRGKMRFKHEVILRSLFIQPGRMYKLEDVNQTYTRLNDLQFFRFINISFEKVSDTEGKADTGMALIDCYIQLSRNPIHSYSTGAEATNSAGDFGVSGRVSYDNRNIFKGAELLSLKLKGAIEIQRRFGDEYSKKNTLFNTFEFGTQASLLFPKFMVPFNQKSFSPYFNPKSILNIGFNFQQRPNFHRYLSELSFGYEWKESKTQRHIFNPLEFNSVSIFQDSSFTAYLDSINDRRLIDQYTDHLITAMRYSYIFNNQQINKKANFSFFRLNIETAGNLLSGVAGLARGPRDEQGAKTLFGIRFAQYAKADGDFRYYNVIGNSTLVYRVVMGLGFPYGNSEALPFDKGFYSGGANGMRGWLLRSLGPGGYIDDSLSLKYERMGDILLENNLEFRFPMVGLLKGALFVDAGNIWLLRNREQYPAGEFKWDSFHKQIAVDGGIGLRVDFSFFIFRLDGALPVRSPNNIENQQWINFSKTSLSDVMWNFGIGYPF